MSLCIITYLITVGYSSVFTNTTISKAIVMPSRPTQATALFNQNIPVEVNIHNNHPFSVKCNSDSNDNPLSGMNAVIKQAAPATIFAAAKGSRRPIRSIVRRMRKAAGNSTIPEMRKSTYTFPPRIPSLIMRPW